jgi:hypothetical protein
MKWGTFLFFAGWVLIMTIFVIFCVPETKVSGDVCITPHTRLAACNRMRQHGQSASTTAADSSHSFMRIRVVESKGGSLHQLCYKHLQHVVVCCMPDIRFGVCCIPTQGVPIEELSEKINNQHW